MKAFSAFFLESENIFELIRDAISELFTLDLGQYENLNLSLVGLANLRSVIIALFLGVIIASYCVIFNRNVYGGFVRSLVNENCGSPASSVTLAQIGYLKKSSVRSALKRGNVYRGVVRCVEQDEYNEMTERKRSEYAASAAASGEKASAFKTIPYKFDFENDHFYIPEEQHYTAESRYNKKGTGILPAILITALCIVFIIVTLKLLPELLQLADNFVGMMGSDSKIN